MDLGVFPAGVVFVNTLYLREINSGVLLNSDSESFSISHEHRFLLLLLVIYWISGA